jgi:hypothetical protein
MPGARWIDRGRRRCRSLQLDRSAGVKPQPALQKVTVLAYRGYDHGLGFAVLVSAAAQYPSHLTQKHIEQLAKDALRGHIS